MIPHIHIDKTDKISLSFNAICCIQLIFFQQAEVEESGKADILEAELAVDDDSASQREFHAFASSRKGLNIPGIPCTAFS